MKRLICLLSVITMLCVVGCSEDFTTDECGTQQTKSSDTSRLLDISTTDIMAMTEADFQTLSAAMERLGVETISGYLVIGRTDYRKLNISKRAYWMIKQACENGNRIVASAHQSAKFPLIKNGYPENTVQTSGSDCIAYALYGMGANQTSALAYVHTCYPDGVPADSLDSVISHFFPSPRIESYPAEDFLCAFRPQPLVWYSVSTATAHAVNAKKYYANTHVFWYVDYSTGSSNNAGLLSCGQSSPFYFPY